MFRSSAPFSKRVLILAMPAVLVCSPLLAETGKQIVASYCNGCHLTGVLEAPRIGNKDDWAPSLEQGYDVLIEHAVDGYKNMPPKGGNVLLTEDEVKLAVDFMLASANLNESTASDQQAASDQETERDDASPPAAGEPPPPDSSTASEPDPNKKPETTSASTPQQTRVSDANKFNRLLVTQDEWNPPPPKDGIHDPANPAVDVLQSPKQAFRPFEKNPYGNHVDWVATLETGEIAPRYDLDNPDQAPVTLDLNIVREVKGSMPNVVYPHKQHTEWLDCVNCHPAIFIPQKGANSMSMASILMGKQCGVCHGTVAFPISECARCHSGSKDVKQ